MCTLRKPQPSTTWVEFKWVTKKCEHFKRLLSHWWHTIPITIDLQQKNAAGSSGDVGPSSIWNHQRTKETWNFSQRKKQVLDLYKICIVYDSNDNIFTKLDVTEKNKKLNAGHANLTCPPKGLHLCCRARPQQWSGDVGGKTSLKFHRELEQQ